MSARPILVTGSQRSGTSWTGNLLCLSGEAGYVHEPFNVGRRPGWAAGRFPHWFQYVCSENEAPYIGVLEEVLAFRYPLWRQLGEIRHGREAGRLARDWWQSLRSRASGALPLIKDPLAVFAAEWLADRFDARVVVMIRHPAAFAGSIKRLGWAFEFENWSRQPLLLRDYLGRYADRITDHVVHRRDLIDQAILMWNAIYHVIDGYRDRRPDWIFVKHEELARDPLVGFHELYDRLEMRWDSKVAARVARYSGRGNPKDVRWNRPGTIRRDSRATTGTWRRRLTDDEVARVQTGVAEVAARFYDADSWGEAPATRSSSETSRVETTSRE